MPEAMPVASTDAVPSLAAVPHDTQGSASGVCDHPGGNFIVLPGGANIKAQIQPAPESGIPPSLERLRGIRPDYCKHAYISVSEACHLLGVVEKTIYNKLCKNRIKNKGHGKFYVPQAELLRAFYRGK